MESIELIHKSSNISWFVTLFIAIVSLVYNWKATRKTQFINTVTSERIRWITTLKEYIAEYSAIANTYAKSDGDMINQLNKSDELRLKISKRLFPLR